MLLVWSGDRPRYHALPIPPDGLTLGRDLLERLPGTVDDDRISRSHTQLLAGGHHVAIRDLVSRNGTFVDGHMLFDSADKPAAARPYAVIRTGRTVWLIVPDVERYQAGLARRGRLVVGGALAETCRAVDAAARDEVHLVLDGSLAVGRELARSYANTVGGRSIRSEPRGGSLASQLEREAARTLVLELAAAVDPRDLAVLTTWLETDLRVVTLVREPRWFAALPPSLQAVLAARRLPIPRLRHDELPTTVYDALRDQAPGARIHATVIERFLLRAGELDEDDLLGELREALARLLAAGGDILRCEHFTDEQFDARHFVVVARRQLPPSPPRSFASEPPDDAGWHRRRLCIDGGCHGVIGEDGTCRICGLVEPLGDPYR